MTNPSSLAHYADAFCDLNDLPKGFDSVARAIELWNFSEIVVYHPYSRLIQGLRHLHQEQISLEQFMMLGDLGDERVGPEALSYQTEQVIDLVSSPRAKTLFVIPGMIASRYASRLGTAQAIQRKQGSDVVAR